ncbi:glycoside hydrolase family 2 protein [Xylariomycetidae sp. FL2044]|nr:glycoside hydrolase family 2 protein [Xylariomycetidae sp. FL2044]
MRGDQGNSGPIPRLLALEAVVSIVSMLPTPGRCWVIPSWELQSSALAGGDLASWSQPGVNTASWHQVNSSRCTLMGCLIGEGIYREDGLFYSDMLRSFDSSQFGVPWLYRHEFDAEPTAGRHYFLHTHGITSKADIFVNGQEIANASVQAGAYAGISYEITDKLAKENALVVQVYPTDYNYDFALGFVDWNPYPPDNGTGVWRDVEIQETGPVAMGPLRIVTQTNFPTDTTTAEVTFKVAAQNLEHVEIRVELAGRILLDGIDLAPDWSQSVTLSPLQTTELVLRTTLQNPSIWWPKQWGDQPLYTGEMSVTVDGSVSDEAVRTFGIRQVTSELNSHNDTLFYVNGLPFQVVGGGYSADMFLRWDSEKFLNQARLMLDLGHNTVRLEGKNEHPDLYDIADRLGLMVMAGFECCDKWEAWTYNEDLAVKSEWTEHDYLIANRSMAHEALMQQGHPSVLAYLVGSDYWPDDKAAGMYVASLKAADWQVPIIASASKRGYPEILGPSGLKMDGPYDWIPPNYWYDVEPSEERLGAAFGFGSELGSGVGTPEMSSLKKFLSEADMNDLWTQPDKGLYHMSTSVSSFYTRAIYNEALWQRYGEPSSLEDYLLKAQMLDYEATRAQFEGFSALWNAERPATGLIYWMLNNAWPSLHWNLFDYYLHPAGSYFGAKTGARLEHVSYNYMTKNISLINHSIDRKGARELAVDVIDMTGKTIHNTMATVETEPNTSRSVLSLSDVLETISDVVFVRLSLRDDKDIPLSRNVYWLASTIDTLDWDSSDWFFTPVTEFANHTALNDLSRANVTVEVSADDGSMRDEGVMAVILENHSSIPAFFIRVDLIDASGNDVLPVFWSDNYVTLWPHERLDLRVEGKGASAIHVSGKNVDTAQVPI